MARLVYYAKERASFEASFPDLAKAPCSFEDAKILIERLSKEYGVTIFHVERTSGRNHSHWNRHTRTIRLNMDAAGWRTVIHEFAHAMDDKLRPGPIKRWHDSTLLDLVLDIGCIVTDRGWHRSIPEERKAREAIEAAKQADREAFAAFVAAAETSPTAVRAKRIERRRAQIVRLERKIRGLTTRLKSARRSLAALERAASKGATT